MEVQGETVGCLKRIVGKHAKIHQSMCQQHAGNGCLARIEMFKGSGKKRPRSQTCFLRQSSLVEFNRKSTRFEKKGTNAQSFIVSHFGNQNRCWPLSSVTFNHLGQQQEIQPLRSNHLDILKEQEWFLLVQRHNRISSGGFWWNREDDNKARIIRKEDEYRLSVYGSNWNSKS